MLSSNSKKKILIIGVPHSKNDSSKKKGGVSRNINNLVNSNFFRKEFEHEIFDDSNHYENKIHAVMNSFYSNLSFINLLKKEKYDLVLLHCNSISLDFFKKFFTLLLIKISGIKVIVRYGGSLSFDFFSTNYLHFIFKIFFSIQDGIVVQGETGKLFYSKYIESENIFPHANFVLKDYISQSEISLSSSDKIQILLVAGSDYIRKGFLESLEVVKMFKSYDSLNFRAIDCNSLVKSEIRKRGLEQAVEVFGSLSYDEMGKLMSESHILVLPSYKEGLPNIILEAMAKGLAVISTPVGSISDVLSDGRNGYLISIGDRFAFFEKLKNLTKDQEKIMEISNNNINKIRKNYSESVVVPKMIDFIHGV